MSMPTVDTFSNEDGSGTGYLDVSWAPVDGVTKYQVILFNGSIHSYWDVPANQNNWTTKGKGMFPTKDQIEGGQVNFRRDGTGSDFSADPSKLYKKAFEVNGGLNYSDSYEYYIRVTAVFEDGASPISYPTNSTIPYDNTDSFFTLEGMGASYTEEESIAIINLIPTVEQYIKPDNNGLLSLSQEFEKQVDPVVYNHFINGIENINKSIQNKEFEIDYNNSQIKLIETNPFELQPFSSTTKHWWGVEWKLSKSEANTWMNRFSDRAFTWGVVSALTGALGAPHASVAAIIMAAGNFYIYKELRDNTSSKGSTLVFKWAPPSVYAKKR
ncbi:hypothetical protein V7146_01820 [Gottfriedia acidiceleris]|uniref:hypothetical protein n=1 Tax=Gottfriedia acidiceleris TaxID=371036 RepID=UPI003000CFA1